MKIKIKLSLAVVVALALSGTLSQCKNPMQSKEPETVTQKDTAVAIEKLHGDTIAAAPSVDTTPQKAPLTLIVNNLRSTTAPVTIGVYGTDNKFPDPKDQLKEYKFTPNGKQLTAKITNLKFGTYALAIYQDVNNNGKIDKTIIGIPTEPYAFSNNYKPTVKAPSFDDCKFEYNAKNNSVTMALLK